MSSADILVRYCFLLLTGTNILLIVKLLSIIAYL